MSTDRWIEIPQFLAGGDLRRGEGAAWLPQAGHAIFVVGGRGPFDEPQRRLTEPFGMGDFQQRIWIAADGKLHFNDSGQLDLFRLYAID